MHSWNAGYGGHTLVGLVAAGCSNSEILAAYPYIEEEDIRQSLEFAAWRLEEVD